MIVNSLGSSSDLFDDPLDWQTPDHGGIELSSAQVDQAIDLSRAVFHSEQQWQLYLHSLALWAVKEWFAEWAPDLIMSEAEYSLLYPPMASLSDAACNLQVGGFGLCVIATGYMVGQSVWIPRAAIEIPLFSAHYYLLVEVLDDQMQVRLHGYQRRDRLCHYQQDHAVARDSDWTVALPLNLFENNPNTLLTELRCLKPDAFPEPLSTVQSQTPAMSLEAWLDELLPQLLGSECSWQEILTWQEGRQLLTHPDILTRLYQTQQAVRKGQDVHAAIASFMSQNMSGASLSSAPSSLVAQRLSSQRSTAQRLNSHQAINAAYWLCDRLDHLAQELSWTLMPVFAAESPLRSIGLHENSWELQIPSEARGIYHDVQLGHAALRLHIIAWPLTSDHNQPGWTLLTVLGAQPETLLPAGVQLQICDEAELLVEQTLDETIHNGYLYAQVGGNWYELFSIKVSLADGATLALSPFTFAPDVSTV